MMKTLLLSEEQTEQAAEIIKRGGLVAMPTETVYGLAADAFNGKAVADNLPLGSYYVVEKTAPEGYDTAEDLPFQV